MEVLLAFLFVVFLTAVRGADGERQRSQSAVLLVGSAFVALALLSHRIA